MNQSSERKTQVVIILLTALIAIVITVFALVTVKPEDQFDAPALIPYPVTTTQQPLVTYPLDPFLSRTPETDQFVPSTVTVIPSRFPQTPTPGMIFPSTLELTDIHIFVVTARIATQQFMLTEYVLATSYMRSVELEKTRRANAPCYCYANVLDCEDFDTRSEAQFCFNYCLREGKGDIHKLDDDFDDIACEKNND